MFNAVVSASKSDGDTILQHTVSVAPENPTYDGQLGAGRPDFSAAMTVVPTQIGLAQQAVSTTFHPLTLYAAVVCMAILTRRFTTSCVAQVVHATAI